MQMLAFCPMSEACAHNTCSNSPNINTAEATCHHNTFLSIFLEAVCENSPQKLRQQIYFLAQRYLHPKRANLFQQKLQRKTCEIPSTGFAIELVSASYVQCTVHLSITEMTLKRSYLDSVLVVGDHIPVGEN